MNNLVEILMRSLDKQAINELAFRGYFSPWTLEQMQRNACSAREPAAAEKAGGEPATPDAEQQGSGHRAYSHEGDQVARPRAPMTGAENPLLPRMSP